MVNPPGSAAASLDDPLLREGAVKELAGEWEAAYLLYGELFRNAARQGDLTLALHALLKSARTLQQGARVAAAEEVADLVLHIAHAHGDTRAEARAVNMLGVSRHRQEEWSIAREYYDAALDLARQEGDDELIAAICQNLGVIANAMGDLDEARALYLEGICSCVRSDSAQIAASTYNNLGMVCADLGEWMEAEIHFLRGMEIAERIGDRALQAWISTGRAEPLIRMGEMLEAARSLDRAESLARQLGDPRALADIGRYRATIARLEGRYDLADAQLAAALALVEGSALELERAEILEETAQLRHAEGRGGAARVLLREARHIYEALGAQRDAARTLLVEQDWTLPRPARQPAPAPSRRRLRPR